MFSPAGALEQAPATPATTLLVAADADVVGTVETLVLMLLVWEDEVVAMLVCEDEDVGVSEVALDCWDEVATTETKVREFEIDEIGTVWLAAELTDAELELMVLWVVELTLWEVLVEVAMDVGLVETAPAEETLDEDTLEEDVFAEEAVEVEAVEMTPADEALEEELLDGAMVEEAEVEGIAVEKVAAGELTLGEATPVADTLEAIEDCVGALPLAETVVGEVESPCEMVSAVDCRTTEVFTRSSSGSDGSVVVVVVVVVVLNSGVARAMLESIADEEDDDDVASAVLEAKAAG